MATTPTEPAARRPRALALLAACGLAAATQVGFAGGSGERVLLIIDPTDATSMHVGNVYRDARDIPDSNVLYYAPGSDTYQAFVERNLEAVFATLIERGTTLQTDYIVLAPTEQFFIAAPGLVNDACSPVTRFSLTGPYYFARQASEILAGSVPVTRQNEYARTIETPLAFSGSRSYSNGRVGNGEAYFISALLGYTGERGNSKQNILDMIDRSVDADFTQPTGTFYFQQTNDVARSGPRDGEYVGVVNSIAALGGAAERRVNEVMPLGVPDALGIMTGAANPDINNPSYTLLPGAFADHLTSWSATFDLAAQTKASRWIAKGASGTWGNVQEPCNYSGKFPSAWLHAQYFQGLSLGEAAMRSVTFLPFQGLLLGDPLTQPFAVEPQVSIVDLPPLIDGPFATLTAPTSTAKPGATIANLELYINGALQPLPFQPGSPLFFSTADLSDGWHEIRVVAREAGAIETRGSASASFVRAAGGRAIDAVPSATVGDLSSSIDIAIDAPDDAFGIQLTQNGRVVAADQACGGTLTVDAAVLGAGPSRLFAEAIMPDGSVIRSTPIEIEIADSGAITPSAAPSASDTVTFIDPGATRVIQLPARWAGDPAELSFAVLDDPDRATIEPGAAPYRLIEADASAAGVEIVRYEVTSPTGSAVRTLTLVYNPLDLDRDGNGTIDIEDLYLQAASPMDIDGDGTIDGLDADLIERVVRCGERVDGR